MDNNPPDDTEIALAEFEAIVKAKLIKFANLYRVNYKFDPKVWPLFQTEGDWWDQFISWDED